MHLHFLVKSHQARLFGARLVFQFNHLKANGPSVSEHIDLFNSKSNFHVNLVHWNSLHPKKAILPTILGQITNLLGDKLKTRTNNLHHQKAGSVAVILSLRVGVQHKPKKCAKIVSMRWQ